MPNLLTEIALQWLKRKRSLFLPDQGLSSLYNYTSPIFPTILKNAPKPPTSPHSIVTLLRHMGKESYPPIFNHKVENLWKTFSMFFVFNISCFFLSCTSQFRDVTNAIFSTSQKRGDTIVRYTSGNRTLLAKLFIIAIK